MIPAEEEALRGACRSLINDDLLTPRASRLEALKVIETAIAEANACHSCGPVDRVADVIREEINR